MSKKTLQRNLNINPEKSKLEDFNNVGIKTLKAFKIKKDKQKILRPYKLNKQNKLKKNDLKESVFSLNEPSLFYKKIESNKKYKFKFIDLFAGIGGFHFAMEELGGKCVFASEIDKHARKTYEANFYDKNPELFDSENFNEDISKQDPKKIPYFDILCGGFPCQPFSIAGYRKGFEDKGRGDLIFNIVEIIKVKQPRVIFLENVKNIA